MKLTTIFLLTTSIICSSWAYPAGSVPDDEVELIGGAGGSGNQPGYNPNPSIPPVPHYPLVPSIPPIPSVPSIPAIPTYPYPAYSPGYNPNYPSFHPGYPAYPTYHPPLFPFGWTYNVFDGFSNFLTQIRSQATTAWNRVPSIKPIINNYWPFFQNNGTTTSTVKVVGDHKFIINETVHVQQSDFGHVVFKVRTVDVKPVEPNDGGATETVDKEYTTEVPEFGINVPDTNIPEITNDENDDRESVADTGDIDVILSGSPEVLENTNEVNPGLLETFETENSTTEGPGSKEELIDSAENINIVKKQPLSIRKEDVEIESLSSEAADRKSDEWANIEIGNVNEHEKTYYEVNNNENDSDEVENVTYDLTNDIAVNEMLADGASYNPDAEVFDITQFEMNREDSKLSSPEEKEPQQVSYDYLPYHYQTSDKRPTNDK